VAGIWHVVIRMEWRVQWTINQSCTRRSPPAKLSTVRMLDGGNDRDTDSKEWRMRKECMFVFDGASTQAGVGSRTRIAATACYCG
jgi:hypothetical protein